MNIEHLIRILQHLSQPLNGFDGHGHLTQRQTCSTTLITHSAYLAWPVDTLAAMSWTVSSATTFLADATS